MNPLTITARTFKELVDPVVPLASRDHMLPILNTVVIETRGEYVTATATDRFRLGICRTKLGTEDEPVSPPEGFRAVIGTRELRTLLAVFKAARYDDPVLSLEVDDDKLTVTQAGGLDGVLGASMSIILATGQYPEVVKVLTDALDSDKTPAEAQFNAAYLGDFKHAVRHGEPITMRFGEGRLPTVVTVGDYFIGAIMPRVDVDKTGKPAGQVARESWGEFLAPKPKAVA